MVNFQSAATPDFHIALVNLKAEASEHSNISSQAGDATAFSAYYGLLTLGQPDEAGGELDGG